MARKTPLKKTAVSKRSKATSSKTISSKTTSTNKDHDLEIDIGFMGSHEESAVSRTIASRQRLRKQMDDEVEQFLAKGGKINSIDPNVTADPPKRPVSNYGQRPI